MSEQRPPSLAWGMWKRFLLGAGAVITLTAAATATAALLQVKQRSQNLFPASNRLRFGSELQGDPGGQLRPGIGLVGQQVGIARLEQDVVIQSGLQPGETVVTEGQLRLEPGTRVQLGEGRGGPGGERRREARGSGGRDSGGVRRRAGRPPASGQPDARRGDAAPGPRRPRQRTT